MPLTGVNWASRPTVKLVTDINGGPGPASSIEARAAWRALSAVLSEADDDFTSATKLAMGNWRGPQLTLHVPRSCRSASGRQWQAPSPTS
jgi:hypothetical protein